MKWKHIATLTVLEISVYWKCGEGTTINKAFLAKAPDMVSLLDLLVSRRHHMSLMSNAKYVTAQQAST